MNRRLRREIAKQVPKAQRKDFAQALKDVTPSEPEAPTEHEQIKRRRSGLFVVRRRELTDV